MDEDEQATDIIHDALALDGTPERLTSFYERWADDYDADVAGEGYCGPAVMVEQLVALRSMVRPDRGTIDPSDRDLRILDAGCGTGLVGLRLRARGWRYIEGCDLSPAMVERARATGVYRALASGQNLDGVLDYADDAFDVTVCCGVFTGGHVTPNALHELVRVTRPGGLVLVSTRQSYYRTSGFEGIRSALVDSGRIRQVTVDDDGAYIDEESALYWVFEVLAARPAKALTTIDLSAFDAPDARVAETLRLRQACLEHGFFMVSGHGVAPELVERALAASRRFFDLPLAVKNQFGQAAHRVWPSTARGYIPSGGETLHPDVGPDLKEAFDLGVERPVSSAPFTGPNVMPDEAICPDFAAAHFDLQARIMGDVVPRLLRALAGALGEPMDWLDPYFTDPILIQRASFYPAGQGTAGRHTDNGILTVLIREPGDACSLRVRVGDAWIEVPDPGDRFIVNLGDLLQHWTGGRFQSTPHEVVHRGPSSRLSIAFFVYPDIDAALVPRGGDEAIRVRDVMLGNFASIWERGQGAGRARELS